MIRFAFVSSLVVLAAGCATPRVQKISFEEAFAHSAAAASDLAHARTKHPRSPRAGSNARPGTASTAPAVATESMALHAELARFSSIAREQRTLVKTGGPMPLVQQQNWERLVGALDELLDKPAAATASTDVIRARAATEAELDMDARAYGDVPAELADQVLDRVTKLAVRMAEVRQLQVKPAKPHITFEWPIDPVVVTSLFGRRYHPILHTVRSHFGIDLGAYSGQLVSAAGKGTVIRAGWNGAHGQQVEIEHPGGIITRYSHLSAILVEDGQLVDRGDPIGLAGSTGLATGPHLHFEFWRSGKPCDPLEELSQQPSRPVVAGTPRS